MWFVLMLSRWAGDERDLSCSVEEHSDKGTAPYSQLGVVYIVEGAAVAVPSTSLEPKIHPECPVTAAQLWKSCGVAVWTCFISNYCTAREDGRTLSLGCHLPYEVCRDAAQSCRPYRARPNRCILDFASLIFGHASLASTLL